MTESKRGDFYRIRFLNSDTKHDIEKAERISPEMFILGKDYAAILLYRDSKYMDFCIVGEIGVCRQVRLLIPDLMKERVWIKRVGSCRPIPHQLTSTATQDLKEALTEVYKKALHTQIESPQIESLTRVIASSDCKPDESIKTIASDFINELLASDCIIDKIESTEDEWIIEYHPRITGMKINALDLEDGTRVNSLNDNKEENTDGTHESKIDC